MKFKQLREISLLSLSIIIEKINSFNKDKKEIKIDNPQIRKELQNSLLFLNPNIDSVNKHIRSSIDLLKELNLISINDENIIYKISSSIKSNNKEFKNLDEKIRETIINKTIKELNKDGLLLKTNDGITIDNDKLKEAIIIDLKENNPQISKESIDRTTRFYTNLFNEVLNIENENNKQKEIKIIIPNEIKTEYKQIALPGL